MGKTMTKHTPGPWGSYFSVHGDPSVVTDANRPAFTKICDVSTAPSDYGRANARLIAAAPDLLECVEAMIAEYEEGREPCFDIREKCRDAITKAKGCHELFDCNDSEHDEVRPAS